MRLKNLTAAEFKKITGGKPWPLVVILIPTLYDMLHGASLILG
jgi:hypothetical protein